MITLLIVDDEDYIRQGIRYAIPWEEYGIKVIGDASDGRDALDIVKRYHPDIILTDIQMPLMDGLELTREVRNILPMTKVILLTAYANTEYFQKAIGSKVVDFVLKNADSEIIKQSVIKARDEIILERSEKEKLERYHDIYKGNRSLLKATLFTRLLNRTISMEHFVNQADKLGIDYSEGSYALILMETMNTDDTYALSMMMAAFHSFQPFAFYYSTYKIVIILHTEKENISGKDIQSAYPQLSPYINSNSMACMIDISSIFEMPLFISYLENAIINNYWDIHVPYVVLSAKDTLKPLESPEIDTSTVEAELVNALSEKKPEIINQKFELYYSFCAGNRISKSEYIDSIHRILLVIYALLNHSFDIQQTISLIEELDDPQKAILVMQDLANVQQNTTENKYPQIMQALDYINGHYMENLYLDDVAAKVYLSPGYLCRIFKDATGYSFKEYVHRVRIMHAEKLIRSTDKKIYEIAEEVGYSNYKYFSSYFSKITGSSATEIRAENNVKN